jgi:ankyrin repeat protein
MAAVRALVDHGADLNVPSADGTPALHWVIHFNDVETARLLVGHGADVNQLNRYGLAPLHVAASAGYGFLVRLLLEANASVDVRAKNGETPLMMAARKGCRECVQALVAHHANVNAQEPKLGHTALMLAAWNGDVEVVWSLIRAGAEVNAATIVGPMPAFKPPNLGGGSHGDGIIRGGVPEHGFRDPRAGGMTPLHYAAREGHTDVVTALLASGAHINQPESNGVQPLLIAILNDHADTARYLIEHGAAVNADDWYGRTPLWAAVDSRNVELDGEINAQTADRAGELELIKLLLAKGANPNARVREYVPTRMWLMQGGSLSWVDFTGQTPFLRAALSGDVTTMRLLLDYKADPNIPTFGGTTPLMAAAGVNWVYFQTFDEGQDKLLEAVKLCVSLGQDVNAANSMGIRAIHGAANRGSDAIVRYLVEQGARLDAKDNQGRTARTWAEGVFLATHAAVPKPTTMRLIDELCHSTGQRCATAARPLPARATRTLAKAH